jgi:hypothetical protein
MKLADNPKMSVNFYQIMRQQILNDRNLHRWDSLKIPQTSNSTWTLFTGISTSAYFKFFSMCESHKNWGIMGISFPPSINMFIL